MIGRCIFFSMGEVWGAMLIFEYFCGGKGEFRRSRERVGGEFFEGRIGGVVLRWGRRRLFRVGSGERLDMVPVLNIIIFRLLFFFLVIGGGVID